MSSSAAQRLPTFEELYQAIEALPPGLTGEILEPGVIRAMSRPGGPHRFTASRIPRSLESDDVVDGGSWWFEQEAEIRLLGERLAVPDLAGWHLGEGEAVPPTFVYDNPIERCPQWCAEILSDSTEKIDRETKVPLYARAGVAWIWLVDPVACRIEVLRCQRGIAEMVEVIDGDITRKISPFGERIDTKRWWLPRDTKG